MRSIRQEISSRLLIGAGVLLFATGCALGLAIHARLVAELDHTLETKVRALAALTSVEGPFIEFDFTPVQMPEFAAENEPEYFELRLLDGRLLAQSPSLRDSELPRPEVETHDPVRRNITLPDGRHGRLVRLLVPVRMDDEGEEFDGLEADDEEDERIHSADEAGGERVVLAFTVARGREDLDGLLIAIYGTLTGIIAFLLISLALVARQAVRRGLQPLAEVNRQVGAIGPAGLQQRIQLAAAPAELTSIIAAINSLLERLEVAFVRERRFSSDVAHELRTPVAELRTACEVGGLWPENTDDIKRFFTDVREIAGQMERIVANLLTLARCDEGNATIEEEAILLEPLVRACGERALSLAGASGAAFELSATERSAAVRTDRGKLEMIVQNLMDNAAAYRVPGTPVRCRIDARDDRLDLCIENQVDSVTREDIAHMCERFWRKDEARTGGTHAGLGLSIAHELCQLLRLDLQIELLDDHVFRVRVSFPSVHNRV